MYVSTQSPILKLTTNSTAKLRNSTAKGMKSTGRVTNSPRKSNKINFKRMPTHDIL